MRNHRVFFAFCFLAFFALLFAPYAPAQPTRGGSNIIRGTSGTTDLTTSNSWTLGDGTSGDVIVTYNGDAGTDGTQTWDVSEDAFVYNSILKLFSDPACTPDTTGDLCFDTDILAAGRGAPCWYDGTTKVCAVGVVTSDTFNNGDVIKANTGGTHTYELDNTGTGLGANLSSSTTDILSNTGAIVLGGTGNTNNEKLSWDYETTANEVSVTTTTGITVLDFSAFTIKGAAFEATANAAPAIKFYDSDGIDADINGQIDGNLTDTGSGTEDFDIFIKQQISGVLTTTATFDADGSITFGLPVIASTVNIDLLDGVGAVDMDYGSADITDHTFVTDSTGDAEIVLPLGSVSLAETLLTAGRSLTISTNDVAADAELYTDEKEVWIETPAVEAMNGIILGLMNTSTITFVKCMTDAGTVDINLEDGADANILSAELVCDVGGQTSCTSGCDVNTLQNTTITSKTEDIDLDISAVSSATELYLMIGYTVDD